MGKWSVVRPIGGQILGILAALIFLSEFIMINLVAGLPIVETSKEAIMRIKIRIRKEMEVFDAAGGCLIQTIAAGGYFVERRDDFSIIPGEIPRRPWLFLEGTELGAPEAVWRRMARSGRKGYFRK